MRAWPTPGHELHLVEMDRDPSLSITGDLTSSSRPAAAFRRFAAPPACSDTAALTAHSRPGSELAPSEASARSPSAAHVPAAAAAAKAACKEQHNGSGGQGGQEVARRLTRGPLTL